MYRMKLLELFDDPHASARDLELELATMVDDGKHFVLATYYLEGDGLAFVSLSHYGLHYPQFQILPAQSVWNFMTRSVHSKLLDCAAQGKCKNYIQMHPLSRN